MATTPSAIVGAAVQLTPAGHDILQKGIVALGLLIRAAVNSPAVDEPQESIPKYPGTFADLAHDAPYQGRTLGSGRHAETIGRQQLRGLSYDLFTLPPSCRTSGMAVWRLADRDPQRLQ